MISSSLRDKIVSAALRLFAEQGFDATSLDAIAKSLGVTRGALYWHFKNKAALFSAVLSMIHAEWWSIVRDNDVAAKSSGNSLNQLLKKFCEITQESIRTLLVVAAGRTQ